jgi:hypothetical protein
MMRSKIAGNAGYILLTVLFILISAGSLFFATRPKPREFDPAVLIPLYSELAEVQRAVQWYEIAYLSSPTPSALALGNINDFTLDINSFAIPSATPSLALPSMLPVELGTIKKGQNSVSINRDFVIDGMQKMLMHLQALPSATPSL